MIEYHPQDEEEFELPSRRISYGALPASTVSRRRHRVDRHVHGAGDLVWASVWISHPAAVTRASVAGCDSPSQCGMACPSTDRGLRLGRAFTIVDPRPRRRVWRCLHPAHPGHGHSRPTGLGVIGSIQRECLDHVVVVGERHLRHVLASYQKYYNEVRTHLSLQKDAPVRRDVCRTGRVRSSPILGGLHHQYVRV
jgi:hypothetical protein